MKKSLIVLLCTAVLGLAGSSAVFAATNQSEQTTTYKIPSNLIVNNLKDANAGLADQKKQLANINLKINNLNYTIHNQPTVAAGTPAARQLAQSNQQLQQLQKEQRKHEYIQSYLQSYIKNPEQTKVEPIAQSGATVNISKPGASKQNMAVQGASSLKMLSSGGSAGNKPARVQNMLP